VSIEVQAGPEIDREVTVGKKVEVKTQYLRSPELPEDAYPRAKKRRIRLSNPLRSTLGWSEAGQSNCCACQWAEPAVAIHRDSNSCVVEWSYQEKM